MDFLLHNLITIVTVQTQRLERLLIYHFEIPRKRSNEQKRVRLEQPSFVENRF